MTIMDVRGSTLNIVFIHANASQLCTFTFLLVFKVFDQSALSLEAKEEMYKLYPNARRAHLKTGGNFPYLCRSAEVNLYIQVKKDV